jgi:alpha-L-rhamnosidase
MGSQTGYVLALGFDLLPEHLRRAAGHLLAAEITKRGKALTTGIVGTQLILHVLADAGFHELAYSLLLRTEYPSWGYMIKNGATTLWEGWKGEFKLKDKLCKASQNHFFFGSVCAFIVNRVSGIEGYSPGFSEVTIRPLPDARVRQGGGDYYSIMGKISTDWRHEPNGDFILDVTIPANVAARVHLLAAPKSAISESLVNVEKCEDLTFVERNDRAAVLLIGSGTYKFKVESPAPRERT